MKWPTIPETLFSLKCFVSSMLAVYIAMKIGVERPFWSMATAYIVAMQPFSGTIRSKGLYRIGGTILSALAVILGIPLLANYHMFFVPAIALWVGICLYFSLLDRTPRSYALRMAAYTVIILAFPILGESESMFEATPFDIAIARVQEIIIGICSATLIHTLFFPISIEPTLIAKLDQTIVDIKARIAAALKHQTERPSAIPYHKLAQDITELRLMSTHLLFDISHLRWTPHLVYALHDRLAALVLTVASIEERQVQLFEAYPEVISAAWRDLLKEIAAWCESSGVSPEGIMPLHKKVNELMPLTLNHAAQGELLLVGLAVALQRLLETFTSCFDLRDKLDEAIWTGKPSNAVDLPYVPNRVLHTEKLLALHTAAVAALAAVSSSALWMITAWPHGYNAPMFACIFCVIHAMRDNPVPSLKSGFWSTVIAAPVSALYLLLIIPYTPTIEMLALALLPFLFCIGFLIIRPFPGISAMMLLISVSNTLALYDYGAPDLAAFLNGQLATLAGMGIAILFTVLFRNLDVIKVAHRVVMACWRESVLLCGSARLPSLAEIAVRMTDRIALVSSHLSASKMTGGSPEFHIMGDIQINLGIAYLRGLEAYLREAQLPIRELLDALSRYFGQKLRRGSTDSGNLLENIDSLLNSLSDMPPSSSRNEAIAALATIRQELFPKRHPGTNIK